MNLGTWLLPTSPDSAISEVGISVWNSPVNPNFIHVISGGVASLLASGESQLTPQFLIKTSIFVPQKKLRPLDVLFFWGGEEVLVGELIGPKIPILHRAPATEKKKHFTTLILMIEKLPETKIDLENRPGPKRKFHLNQPLIFRSYVGFRECNLNASLGTC